MVALLHKIIKYDSGYENGTEFPYQIAVVYRDGFGLYRWVDLEAIEPDISTHFEEHLSVPIAELNLEKS